MNFKAILAWARSVETSEHSPPLCHPRPQQTRANFADILDGEWQVSNYGAHQYITKKSEHIFNQAATELYDAPISGSSVPSEASSLPTEHAKSSMKPKEMLSGEDKVHCSHSEVGSETQKTTKEIPYEVFAETELASWKRLFWDHYDERKTMLYADPNYVYEWPPITPGVKAAMDPTALNTDLANSLVGESLLSALDADGTWDRRGGLEGECEEDVLKNDPQVARATDTCTDTAFDVAQMRMDGSPVEKTTTLLSRKEAIAGWPHASSFSVPDSRMGLSWYDIAGYGTSVWARTASELLSMNHPASATPSASSPSPDHSPLTVASSPTVSSTTSPRTSSIDVYFEPLDDKAEKECRVKEHSETTKPLTNVFEPSEPSTYEVAAEIFTLFPATERGTEYCSMMFDVPLQIAEDGAN